MSRFDNVIEQWTKTRRPLVEEDVNSLLVSQAYKTDRYGRSYYDVDPKIVHWLIEEWRELKKP